MNNSWFVINFEPIIFLYSNPTDTTSVPKPTPTMNGGM